MTLTAADTRLKPLNPDDLEPVIAIDMAGGGTSRRGYFEKRLSAAIERPGDYIFVGAEADGELAGFALARMVGGAFGHTDLAASLDAIGVRGDRTRQGLGRQLLAEVESILRRKGVTRLTSQIDWMPGPVSGFLAGAGFRLAPRMVLSRRTDAMPDSYEEEDTPTELDFSVPVGDPGNALTRDRVPVRSMRQDDLARIVRIDSESTGADRSDYYTRKLHESLGQSGVQVSLVAEHDGFAVGFIMARVDFGEFGRTGSEAVMDSIGVEPDRRGQGIGGALMARLMGNLAALRVDSVRTEIDWNDTPLIDYFSHSGFAPAQRISLEKSL